MKIKGKLILELTQNMLYDNILRAKVNFRVPGKLFTQSDYTNLLSDDEISTNEFFEECKKVLQDKEYLIKTGQGLIKDYMDRMTNNTEKNNKTKEIEKLISQINKEGITIEIDYKN